METQLCETRTARDAGWRVSRYNLRAHDPKTGRTIIANLMSGSSEEYSSLELFLMDSLDRISENHPIIGYLEGRGLICDYDELAAIEAQGRIDCAKPDRVALVICPTMGCNFDCPYCFENHAAGKMMPEVQDDVVALAERMLEASGAKDLKVTWFGGEPLLATDVIESLSKRLIELVDGRGGVYEAGVITNGYLLTQDVVDMLERMRVQKLQVTLDGLARSHNASRPLAGGGPTFERIVSNLRELKFGCDVLVRQNVHEGNRKDIAELESMVKHIAEESGNTITCYQARIHGSDVADGRGCDVSILAGKEDIAVAAREDARRFGHARSVYCSVHELWNVGIDHLGNLCKCWESVDKPETSFGTAREWDPAKPIRTASNRDMLSCYLSAGAPLVDPECRDCVWLPHCAGGCPHERLFGSGRRCVPYKDDPEAFVLALHAQKNE